jgi:N-acetylmuramic acid 6-phosphate (MurNAc-6-P) etherase
VRILQMVTARSRDECRDLLDQASGRVKRAIEMNAASQRPSGEPERLMREADPEKPSLETGS